MRIINPIDQDRIASSVESVGRDLLRELPSLSKGQVVISGASVNTPVMLRVRTRITPHGGQDANAPERWVQWFEDGQDQVVERATAPMASRPELPVEEDGDVLWAR
jgi:DNA helicase HerA-like ATPase